VAAAVASGPREMQLPQAPVVSIDGTRVLLFSDSQWRDAKRRRRRSKRPLCVAFLRERSRRADGGPSQISRSVSIDRIDCPPGALNRAFSSAPRGKDARV
jgi:hypothetical protein